MISKLAYHETKLQAYSSSPINAQAGSKRYLKSSMIILAITILSACGDPPRSNNYEPEEITPFLQIIADADTNLTTATLTASIGTNNTNANVVGLPNQNDNVRLTHSDHFTLTRDNTSKILYRRSEPLIYETQFDGVGQHTYTLKFSRRGVPENINLNRSYTVAAVPTLIADFAGSIFTTRDTITFSWQAGDPVENLKTVELIPSSATCTTTAGATLSGENVFGSAGLNPLTLDQTNAANNAGASITVPLNTLFAEASLQGKSIVSCEASVLVAVAVDDFIKSQSTSVAFTLQVENP